MNILFYSFYGITLKSGGTEKATLAQARMLNQFEYIKCFHVYSRGKDEDFCNSPFLSVEHIDNNDSVALSDFLKKNEIDIFVNEGNIFKIRFIEKAIKKSKRKIRKIFVHHYAPGTDVVYSSVTSLLKNSNLTKMGIKNLAKVILYPILTARKYRVPQRYKFISRSYDSIVLLSSGFIDEFCRMGGITDKSKFSVIPNVLSFEDNYEMLNYDNKEKVVLILGRLEEYPKNISSALRIWREIEKNKELKDWRLEIVGNGEDEAIFKKFAAINLKRVSFKGRQMSESYFEKSAVFMMTSIFEGFGIVLLEAQQKGCVPMAYDTYLALHDIITNGENGIIIPPFDEKLYAEKLSELMKDKEMRVKMAAKGIETCQRYSFGIVSRQWHKLIEQYM